MFDLDRPESLFVLTAFLFQAVLIAHFALRKWNFSLAIRFGWIVYALSIPAASVSVLLLRAGLPWSLWLGGLLYLTWAVFGYAVEYVAGIAWRSPPRWRIFGPYLFLYLSTVMFYWWPLSLVDRPLWIAYALLFIVSTILNLASHRGSARAA